MAKNSASNMIPNLNDSSTAAAAASRAQNEAGVRKKTRRQYEYEAVEVDLQLEKEISTIKYLFESKSIFTKFLEVVFKKKKKKIERSN
jgi:hypothetical protein